MQAVSLVLTTAMVLYYIYRPYAVPCLAVDVEGKKTINRIRNYVCTGIDAMAKIL